MNFLAILAVFAFAGANVTAKSPCSLIQPVENFDLSKFLGTYFEYARYQNKAEDKAKCGKGEYTSTSADSFSLKYTHVFEGKLKELFGTGKIDPEANGYGVLNYQLPYGPGGKNINVKAYVIDTDYDNYAVLVYCKADEVFSWILSRTPELSLPAKAALDTSIKSSKVLDSKKYLPSDFSESACKYES